MAEIIDIQAPPGQVVNAFNEMRGAAQRFDGSLLNLSAHGATIHDPFLKGERAVSRASGALVTNLLSATSATDALAGALVSVERGGRLGLGLAVGVAIGVAAFEALSKAIEQSKKVHEAAEKQLSRPLSQQVHLDAAGISKEFEATKEALNAEIKQDTSFSEAVISTFGGALQNILHPIDLPGGSFGSGRNDKNFERQIELNERLDKLSKARGEAELGVVAAKEASLHNSTLEGEQLKIQMEYAAKIASLRLDPVGSAGFKDSAEAARRERDLALEQAKKKDALTQIELSKDAADSAIEGGPGAIKAQSLQNQIEADAAALQKIIELGGTEVEQTKAKIKLAVDLREQNQRRVDDEKELQSAVTDNQVTTLKQQGLGFEANILKIREATEAKIAQHLKDQKTNLAAQDAISGQLQLREAAKAALRDPQGTAAKERAGAQEDAQFDQKIAYYKAQLARGIKFDETDPTINIIKQYLAAKNKLATSADPLNKTKEDFSSVASLAGKDFSGMASLAEKKFPGLEALAKLQLTVA